mmetsp:Transcript_67816/g.196375  ORF Transcript_67816/g.196375 Transcript_67816/m.196375 type:complete len:347 (+) Transcript_67816:2255-3295(+)
MQEGGARAVYGRRPERGSQLDHRPPHQCCRSGQVVAGTVRAQRLGTVIPDLSAGAHVRISRGARACREGLGRARGPHNRGRIEAVRRKNYGPVDSYRWRPLPRHREEGHRRHAEVPAATRWGDAETLPAAAADGVRQVLGGLDRGRAAEGRGVAGHLGPPLRTHGAASQRACGECLDACRPRREAFDGLGARRGALERADPRERSGAGEDHRRARPPGPRQRRRNSRARGRRLGLRDAATPPQRGFPGRGNFAGASRARLEGRPDGGGAWERLRVGRSLLVPDGKAACASRAPFGSLAGRGAARLAEAARRRGRRGAGGRRSAGCRLGDPSCSSRAAVGQARELRG